MDINEWSGSELGTIEYWNESYKNELKNYKCTGDVGDIWFDESSQDRIITWLNKKTEITKNCSIIDIGCGNGMMLIELARCEFMNLTGVDYSPDAINLAKSIANHDNININYFVMDLLNDEDVSKMDRFNIVHDKGTYDAISLHPDNPKLKCNIYIENLSKLLTDDGFLIITSCNWTEDELKKSFQNKFTLEDIIPTPMFKFGGKTGHIVTSIVFRKQKK